MHGAACSAVPQLVFQALSVLLPVRFASGAFGAFTVAAFTQQRLIRGCTGWRSRRSAHKGLPHPLALSLRSYEEPSSALLIDAAGKYKLSPIPIVITRTPLIPTESREVQLSDSLFRELQSQQHDRSSLRVAILENRRLSAGAVGCLASVEFIGDEKMQEVFKRASLRGESAIAVVAEPSGHGRPVLLRGKTGRDLFQFRGSTVRYHACASPKRPHH